MVITAFGEEHVGLHDDKKEKLPAVEGMLALKTPTPQGKTNGRVTQVLGR